jgi:hypothetical protein
MKPMLHSILLEEQISNKCRTLFCCNSRCPTSVPLYSAVTASVQQVSHSILLGQQLSNNCPTLLCWKSMCSTSVPLYSAGTVSVQHMSHPTFHRPKPNAIRDVPKDPGSNSSHDMLSELLQWVTYFHILPQASSLISSLPTSCKPIRLSNRKQNCW